MGGRYDRQRFLARLLLLSAFNSDGDQGSTSGSTGCNCCGNFAIGSFHVANIRNFLSIVINRVNLKKVWLHF